NLTLTNNGWASRKTIADFTRYTEVLFNRYKGVVKYLLTFNDINSSTWGFTGTGAIDSDLSLHDQMQLRYQALHHEFVASAIAPDEKTSSLTSLSGMIWPVSGLLNLVATL
ncbi:hypothetical protein WP50_21700, partial [Lactiplantibacillus plantarum]